MRFLTRYFLRGLLVGVPLAVTIYATVWVLLAIDRLIPASIPGLGLVLALVAITALGAIASNVVGRRALALAERQLDRLPLLKLLYSALKDLIGAFVGEKKSFNRPVMVLLPGLGDARVMGFLTRDGLPVAGLPDHVAVYLPQSYNFAGSLVLFPREQVHPVDMDPSDFMALIVSAAVAGPRDEEPAR